MSFARLADAVPARGSGPSRGVDHDPAATSVADLIGLDAYRQARLQLFPSEGSLQWFIRKHRVALITAGALKLHAGRWMAHQGLFDTFVLDMSTVSAELHSTQALRRVAT